MAKLPYTRPVRPPFIPIPFPIPPEYDGFNYKCPDRQEYEVVFEGIVYDGKSGRPKRDLRVE
jgi:hypothetical protein